jgi:Na+/melibiose symporter-like transporter
MGGAVPGILVATQLVKRFQKHHLLIGAIAASICINASIPVLRLGDVFPPNNSLFFLPLLMVMQGSLQFFWGLRGCDLRVDVC